MDAEDAIRQTVHISRARRAPAQATNGANPAMTVGRRLLLPALLALALLGSTGVGAQQGTIEQIIPQGLSRMQPEAFLHALGLKPGDPYDVKKILARYKALWAGGWFENIVFETEDGPKGGKVLVIKVRERPTLTAVTYEENSVVTRTAIEDRLKERKVELKPSKPLDLGQVFAAETTIRDLLAEKGYLNAEVKAEVRTVTETTRAVNFAISPGGKTRIVKIDFSGNEVFSDKKLKSQLKMTEAQKWYWPWSKKSLYHPLKWDQDAGNIRQLYLNNGYLDIEVRAPIVEFVGEQSEEPGAKTKKGKGGTSEAGPSPEPTTPPAEAPPTEELTSAAAAEELTPKQRQKLINQQRKAEKKARKKEKKAKQIKRYVSLTVPVVEGKQYTLGTITFSGNEEIPENLLRSWIPLHDGAILRNDLLDAGIDRINRIYEDRGHLYANVVRNIRRHEGESVADVDVTIDEDKAYYVDTIEFAGNTSTRDNVLRREVLLKESDLFNRTALDVSKIKLNQLGYWQTVEEPVVEPIEGENQVNVTIAGEEQGRNEIQVGGGYSGVDGAFFNGVYSTRNFLGRGQIVSLALQVGGRSNRYQLSFQEPWLFNKPYTFGFSIFRRDVDYGASLASTSTGFGLLVGKRLGRFSNLNLGYNWQNVSSTSVAFGAIGAAQLAVTTQTTVASLTPVYRFSTVNNPYRPTRGHSFDASFQLAGGPLGGDTSFIKPILTWTQYAPAAGTSYIAFHTQGGFIRQVGGESLVSASNIEGVPRFERFWLGGDTLGPRVFETRSITPLRYVELDANNGIINVIGDPRYLSAVDLVNAGGVPVVIEAGGDRFYLVQTEYVFPMNEQIELAAFVDFGDSLFEDQGVNLDTLRMSAGFELRFHLPIFPVPLRLIYGWPIRQLDRDQTSNFTFSIGRSF